MTTRTLTDFYWISITLFALMMAASGVMYLVDAPLKERFTHLGFPSYFRIELATFKLAGAVVLLLPFPDFMKEWAFAGFFIVLASASIAHRGSGDGPKKVITPMFVAAILALSYIAFRHLGHA
ncbi:MAG: DoxX family protein [Acidobacteriaceae bacterium]